MINSSTYVWESHAITGAIQKWRHYLLGKQFITKINKQNLKELMNKVVQTPEQQYYLSKLLGYDYISSYKSGKANEVADALSGQDFATPSQLLLVSVPIYDFLTELQTENEVFPDLQAVHKKIAAQAIIIPSLNPYMVLYIGTTDQF